MLPTTERSRFPIDMRVTGGRSEALVAQERLHVAQVGAALVEQERGGRVPQRVGGDGGHAGARARRFEADVECLVAEGPAIPSGKDQPRPRELNSPAAQPHAPDALQKREPLEE